MAEREDTGFKVTDRRKYNPDGSPREATDEAPIAEKVAEKVVEQPDRESAPAKVLSFPAEASNKQSQLPDSEPATADARQAQASTAKTTEEAAGINRAE